MYKRQNGNRYHGEWVNGRINGRGNLIEVKNYVDGHKIARNSIGLGTLFLSNGDKYIGDWKDGKRHGHGVFHYKCDILLRISAWFYLFISIFSVMETNMMGNGGMTRNMEEVL